MSAMRTGSAVAAANVTPLKPKTHGFLRIARHGAGPGAMYVIAYHRLAEMEGPRPRPVAAESAQALIELLERIGLVFRLSEARGALEDILRFGSANIPDLWPADEEIIDKVP